MPAAAVRELKQIPFGSLIGGPLKASVEAQAMAAMTTVDFIQRVGFKSEDNSAFFDDEGREKPQADFGELRMATFKYLRKDADGERASAELHVPLLTILPIPHLTLDEVNVNFRANLNDTVENTTKSDFKFDSELKVGYKAFWSPVSVDFRASVSYQRTSETKSKYTREYAMDVSVRATQDDMPAGMAKMLEILEDAIQVETEGQQPAPG